MNTIICLLTMTTAAYAVDGFREGDGDSWKTPDKAAHAAAGFIIAGLTDLVLDEAAPNLPRWKRVGISILAATLAGTLKEVYDHQHPDTHDCSLKDASATVLGGVVGAVAIDFTIHF